MGLSLRYLLRAGALGLALCAAGLPFRSRAAEANLEGTWKVATPGGAFKPEGGEIPFTEEGRKVYEEHKASLAANDLDFDHSTSRCASPGLPRLLITPLRFRIWQRPGLTMFQFEWNRLFRQIDMGGLTQPQFRLTMDPDAELVGRAIPISEGRWEGDTLVVTTDGLADNTLIDNLVPHGYELKLTERIRLKGPDVLENRITIEDPEYFTRPWETVVTYQRQPDEAFPESVCFDKLNPWQ